MEVGIRLGMCNNSPAEWTCPENGWRLNVMSMLGLYGSHQTVKSRWMQRLRRRLIEIWVGASSVTDLGGSSKYSSEILEV